MLVLYQSLAGASLVAHEGAFSTYLLTYDPFEPQLRFTDQGKLRKQAMVVRGRPGWGLELTAEPQSTDWCTRIM